ncbi:MAG: hypothetical protein M3Q81_01905 [bacterium]|nr:hypothetical protein [bacterium]
MATQMPTQSAAEQRHHDYYVRLQRKGKMTEEDRPQYELAMRREREGEVKPLPEE